LQRLAKKLNILICHIFSCTFAG